MTPNDKKSLTRTEHRVMMHLWNLPAHGGTVRDIVNSHTGVKPAYTTISTFMKILAGKGYVRTEKVGTSLFYTPRVSKEAYCRRIMARALQDYFEGDPVRFIRFVAGITPLSDTQKDTIRRKI